jgi:hypothetical protein
LISPRKPQAGGSLLTSSRHRSLVVSTGTPPAQIGTYRAKSRNLRLLPPNASKRCLAGTEKH